MRSCCVNQWFLETGIYAEKIKAVSVIFFAASLKEIVLTSVRDVEVRSHALRRLCIATGGIAAIAFDALSVHIAQELLVGWELFRRQR